MFAYEFQNPFQCIILEGGELNNVKVHRFSDEKEYIFTFNFGHIFTNRYKKMHEDYERMKSAGFLKFWMRNEGRDHWLPAMVTQAEVTYINSKFK